MRVTAIMRCSRQAPRSLPRSGVGPVESRESARVRRGGSRRSGRESHGRTNKQGAGILKYVIRSRSFLRVHGDLEDWSKVLVRLRELGVGAHNLRALAGAWSCQYFDAQMRCLVRQCRDRSSADPQFRV